MPTPETGGRNGTAIPACWAEQFQPHILQRGFDYYLSGRVADLRVDDGAWHARVAGRVSYAVTVPFEATGGEASCSCPHFADGYECKHIAAVCFAIQDTRLGLAPAGAAQESATHDVGDIRELVNRLGVQELRKIVCDLVARDRALGRRIELEYGAAKAEVAFAELRADLLSLAVYDVEEFSRATDDWETQCDANALVEATLRPLFDGGRVRECVDITVWLQDFLLSFGMGEGIQVAAGAMGGCLDWWRRIADALAEREDDAALRDDACRRMAEALWVNRGAISDLAGDYSIERAIGSLARATDDAKTLELLLAVVDDFIDQHSRTLLQVGGRSLEGYGTSGWVRLRLDLLKRSGATLRERLTLAGDRLHLFDVASTFADDYLEQGEWRRAVEILEEGRRGAEDRRESGKFAYRLAQLYEEKGDLDQARELVRRLVLDGGLGLGAVGLGGVGAAFVDAGADDAGREDPFHWLKRLTDDETWLEGRDALIDAISSLDYRLRCLASEGMYERLRDEIDGEWRRGPTAYRAFLLARRYRESLGRLFPEWMIRLYRASISEELDWASKRSAYRAQVELLVEMCDFEGGAAAAQKLADDLRYTYPRRTALKDELSKAGF